MFQKHRKKDDKWDANATAYGRYWKDVPGGSPKRVVFSLGVIRTRTLAKRKLAEHLAKLGLNTKQHFIESTSRLTFAAQGEYWLDSLSHRKRNPVASITIENRRYALDKWLYPAFGDSYLADINNLALKQFVEQVSETLAPASIRDYLNIVKAVVASAIDENGEQKFPRTWNEEYIDAPIVKNQHQPSTTRVGEILEFAQGQYQVLYALLAGCGPMRPGEALGLEIDKHISSDFRTLTISQKALRGAIEDHTKTASGMREVDLCAKLTEVLREFVGDRKSGLLFKTASGRLLSQNNIVNRSLHPILDHLQHERGGLYIFRRFRRTYLDKFDCPESLKHFWSGHAPRHVSERYIKLAKDREFRLMWAEKIGLGFTLPGLFYGQLREPILFRTA